MLTVGIPGTWGNLIPSLQHTAFADSMLSNEFDSLVKIGEGGVVIPIAAKKWKIEDNYKTFIFTIDTNLKFSNGESLKAEHFKKSWEHSLTLSPKSSNNSLQDNLYKVEGYEDFKKNGHISGLIAKDDQTFIVKFKNPFRMGLENLTGSRMSVFIIKDNKYIGTGPFRFIDYSEKHAILEPNPYSERKSKFKSIKYIYTPSQNAAADLKSNKIQLFVFADRAKLGNCQESNSNIGCYIGNESQHAVIVTNGLKSRLFSNNNHRKAFQKLVHDNLTQKDLPEEFSSTLKIDPQLYLPLQKGRLNLADSKALLDEGTNYIKEFIAATKKTPLLIYFDKDTSWVVGFIKKLGISVSTESKLIDGKTKLNSYYKAFEPDLLPLSLSVVSCDPDGVYHAFGKNGAIASPMTYRENTANLLEIGRNVMEPEKVHIAYQNVSKAALEEVPVVHLGFIKTRTAYRKDLIRVRKEVKDREDDKLIIFEPL